MTVAVADQDVVEWRRRTRRQSRSGLGGANGGLLAPGVEGVVDEQPAVEKPLVVVLDAESSLADGQ